MYILVWPYKKRDNISLFSKMYACHPLPYILESGKMYTPCVHLRILPPVSHRAMVRMSSRSSTARRLHVALNWSIASGAHAANAGSGCGTVRSRPSLAGNRQHQPCGRLVLMTFSTVDA